MIDKVVISIWLTAILTILTVAIFLLIIPLYHRIEFDSLCQEQLMRMEIAGGLSSAEATRFKQAIQAAGFQVDRLAAPVSAPFGSDLTLFVEATRPGRRIGVDLTIKEAVLSFTFHRTVLCRKIITDAGEPLGSY